MIRNREPHRETKLTLAKTYVKWGTAMQDFSDYYVTIDITYAVT